MRGFTLTDRSVVEFYPLHIGQADQGEHEVGRPDTGDFISLPPEGVQLLTWLQAGLPLGVVKEQFAEEYGQAPDLEDFLEALAECHFLRRVDDQVLEEMVPMSEVRPSRRGWVVLAQLPPERVRWLHSWPMYVVYAAVWIAVPTLLVRFPSLLPTPARAWVSQSVIANALALAVLGWGVVCLHEVAHMLAAKSYGCSSALTISHRLHLLVAQTDLTAVRTLPRRQRYGPYLAGMTNDMGILLLCLLLQIAAIPSPLPAVLAYLAALDLVWQSAFFLRTDLYYVFATALRLGNLLQDTQRWLLNRAARVIGRPAPYDLSAVPPRELAIIRWYALFYLVGVGVVLGGFFILGLPLLLQFVRQAIMDMAVGPTRLVFWDGLAFLALVLLNFGVLGWLLWRDQREARREPAARSDSSAVTTESRPSLPDGVSTT